MLAEDPIADVTGDPLDASVYYGDDFLVCAASLGLVCLLMVDVQDDEPIELRSVGERL